MYKRFGLLFVLLAALAAPVAISPVAASVNRFQDQQNQNKRVLNVPHRHRRRGRDTRRHRGIGHAYKNAGKSAGHGGKHFGKHMRHGRPLKAGKALGKGMGGFGKGVGKGTGRTGKKVGKKIKHAVTP
jgi:Ni/Co efflux regulator RcnB